jgi:hypothetical protein
VDAGTSGAALHVESAIATVTGGVEVYGNAGRYFGAFVCNSQSTAQLTLTGSVYVHDNFAPYGGGGLSLWTNCICEITGDNDAGGGVVIANNTGPLGMARGQQVHARAVLMQGPWSGFLFGGGTPGVSTIYYENVAWSCPLGYWLPQFGALDGVLSSAARAYCYASPCAGGYYGNAPNHSSSTCAGPCVAMARSRGL